MVRPHFGALAPLRDQLAGDLLPARGVLALARFVADPVEAAQPRDDKRVVSGQTQRIEKQPGDATVARGHLMVGRL